MGYDLHQCQIMLFGIAYIHNFMCGKLFMHALISRMHYSDVIIGRDGVSNYQRLDCLLTCLFWHRSKKTSKLHVTGFCEGNSPVTGEFPTHKANDAENVSIWWRHKNIERHTAHAIVSWHNPKQWIIVHTSDLMMIIRQSVYSLNHHKGNG